MTVWTRAHQTHRGVGRGGARRALVGAGAMVLAVGSLGVGASVSAASPVTPRLAGTAVPVVAPATDRATCSDLVIIGIDGNGQGKGARHGQVVGKVVKRLGARARAESRTVTTERVRLNTPGAKTVLRTQRGGTLKAISKKGLNRWRKPIGPGVKKTRKLVRARLAACPERQVVLVGYAQGAAVAHRVSQVLAKTNHLPNVAAVVTVSDPDRVRMSSAGRPLGKPAATNGSTGVIPRFGKSVGDTPKPAGTFGVVPVCHRGDLVCNPNKSQARKALRTALSYGNRSSNGVIKQAADRAWAQVSLWPISTTTQVTVRTQEAFSQQLTVGGGSPSAPAATWTPVQVPAGLSLSADGVLTGVVATPGIYEVRFSVAGVSPATTPKSGALLLRASATSGASTAGGMSSCAVQADGTALCWGRNDFGQLGDGTNTLRINPTPVQGTGWSRIASGGNFTCGVKTDGTLWCWGLNNFGQLGGSDRTPSNVPRQVGTATNWREVTASWTHACATQDTGALWCWGQNHHGQLGNGQTSGRSAPVAVSGARQWVQVSAGEWHTCGVVATGEAYCWGNNAHGQLGDGTNAMRKRPRLVAGGHQFAQVSAVWGRSCGVTPAGGVLCWGDNSNGELGNGSRTDSNAPVAVAGDRAYAQVATALTSTCATQTDGNVLCWGDNRYGQLGASAEAAATSPTATGVTSTGGLVSGGWFHFCGADYCWGANDAGQLGNNALTQPAMPEEAAPPWGPITRLTDKQVRQWGAKRIARTAIAGRPGASREAVSGRRGKSNGMAFEVMSFNVLGSQHTAPSGSRPAFAPGRVRIEWAKDLIERRGATLIGLSEPQPDQITQLDVATRGGYSYYPGNTNGYDPAPQSIMWKDSDWEFVWGNTAQMPFMRKSRPQPVVRLKHKATGRHVYMINAHLSPGKMQADRDKGMEIIVQLVKQLHRDKLPIIVTGDLNEHGKAFRRIACRTFLKAAVGGVATTKRCVLPKHMRVDWLFGGGGRFSNTSVDVSPRVRRTTDHAVVSSRFTVQ